MHKSTNIKIASQKKVLLPSFWKNYSGNVKPKTVLVQREKTEAIFTYLFFFLNKIIAEKSLPGQLSWYINTFFLKQT